MSRRQARITERVAQLASEFLARESADFSLTTVTRADVSPDLKQAIIFLSVLPRNAEQGALASAKRNRSAFRQYVSARVRFKHLPTFDFELDYGERNRQRVDELTRG